MKLKCLFTKYKLLQLNLFFYILSLLVSPLSATPIALPRHLYFLTSSLPIVLFPENTLSGAANDPSILMGPYGESTLHTWTFKMSNLPAPTAFPLTLTYTHLHDVAQANTTCHLVPPALKHPIVLLPIGDSLTRGGYYLNTLEQTLPQIKFLGTRFYPDDGLPPREGRGGWTLEKYFAPIGSYDLDSPFIFPTTVSGTHYKGNTKNWQAICTTKTHHPSYDGFQKLARLWQDDGDFAYDEKGYFKTPLLDDVMFDPTLPPSVQWQTWTGTNWVPLNPQPRQFEFNFSKYMERFSYAFTPYTPTHVSILLGANDFGFTQAQPNATDFIHKLQEMITSIHTYDANIKIMLCIPPLGPDPNCITSHQKSFYQNYQIRLKTLAHILLQAFDTDEALCEQIYIVPMYLTLDTQTSFDYLLTKDPILHPLLTQDVKNSIHPNQSIGQQQMGLTLAGVLAGTQ